MLLLLAPILSSEQPGIDDFFRDFTSEWMRGSPSAATSSRYFTGEEQTKLERELTPETQAYRRSRIELARKGLTQLGKFDKTRMTETQSLSADLLQWDLDTIVREEPFLDYSFPLQQMSGANVNLIEVLTVRHPLARS